jgi:ubiquinone/menaquinone biosynthesis C-methylase UbiE
MNTKESIYKAYDDAAKEYAKLFSHEIAPKNLDCILLKWLCDQIQPNETILEIGSGPGEVTGYIYQFHPKSIGTDQSIQMIQQARKYFPNAQFQVQDFYSLTFKNNSIGAVIAFYAIVNLTLDEIIKVFKEVKRVLRAKGIFLFTFHLAEESNTLNIDRFFRKNNPLLFYLYKADEIKVIIEEMKFEIVDIITRYPYPKIEHPTKRVHFIVRKK